jgi:hypothetical protein
LTHWLDASVELEVPLLPAPVPLALPLPLPLLPPAVLTLPVPPLPVPLALPAPLPPDPDAFPAIAGLAAPPRLMSGASLERSGSIGTMGVCVHVPCGAGILQLR